MTTPAEKDAMALAVIEREANEISLCGGAMFANELREARAHLAARVAELEDSLTIATFQKNKYIDRATSAEAELAAVREDADRYRWLRDAHLDNAVDPHRWGDAYTALGEPWPAERVNAAVDAARGSK